MKDHTLTPVMEDYIETILQLIKRNQVARVSDIAEKMKVAMSTVTNALKNLTRKKLINYAPYSTVSLTPTGKKIAEQVLRRHEILTNFFYDILSVPPDVATENACRIEHHIDNILLERLVKFAEFVESCPSIGLEWKENIGYVCQHGFVNGARRCTECELAKDKMRASDLIGLEKLKPGQKGKIERLPKSGGIVRRMLDMGVTPGSIITVDRIAPLGDPIEIKVRGYHLSLRKEEAASIFVYPL